MQAAIDDLWTYTGELFDADETEAVLAAEGIACNPRALEAPGRAAVSAVLREATLTEPAGAWMQRGGKHGVHSEHLGRMLATMQHLQRAFPGAQW